MIERVWEWRFAAPPEMLWPVLADTARFNEAVGLPRYAVSETPLPDGSVGRTGSARKRRLANSATSRSSSSSGCIAAGALP